MHEAITYVGIDTHKKNLAVAMLVGHERPPTTWTAANEPQGGRTVTPEAAPPRAGANRVLR